MRIFVAAVAASAFAVAAQVRAEDNWPRRPITIVVPFQAGGSEMPKWRDVNASGSTLIDPAPK